MVVSISGMDYLRMTLSFSGKFVYLRIVPRICVGGIVKADGTDLK